MSLTDAMLLEGYRDPKEVYIALRTDGLKGSGTIDDPYDGGTRVGPQLAGTISFNPQEIIGVTPIGAPVHGLVNGDSVDISNVTGQSASVYNATHSPVTKIDDVAFKVSTGSVPANPPGPGPNLNIQSTKSGSGSPVTIRLYWPVMKVALATGHGINTYDVVRISGSSESLLNGDFVVVASGIDFVWCLLMSLPASSFSGSCSCSKVVHRFDALIRTNADGSTVIPNYSVVHVGPGTFETRGWSNLFYSNYSTYQARSHVGWQPKMGLKLRGSGIDVTVLKLVHAINELSQNSIIEGSSGIDVAHFEASDFTMDCNLAGQPRFDDGLPVKAQARVTCGGTNLGGDFSRLTRLRVINWGCQAVPECFVLRLGASGSRKAVSNIIEDCIIEKPSPNNTHESTLLLSAGDHDTAMALAPTLRNNYCNTDYTDPVDPSKTISSELVAIASTTVNGSSPPTSGTFTITTKRPHHLTEGDSFILGGVTKVAGAIVSGGEQANNPYLAYGTRTYRVTHVNNATSFDTEVLTDFPHPDDPMATPPILYKINFNAAYIGATFHGTTVGGGSGGVVGGNRLYGWQIACYQDTGSDRDCVVRDNYWSNVKDGLYVNLQTASSTTRSAIETGGISVSGTEVTINTPANAHNLAPGYAVDVSGVTGITPLQLINSTHTVKAVTSTSFTFDVPTAPVGTAGGAEIKYQHRWQKRRAFIENNVVDVYRVDNNSVGSSPNDIANPRGVILYGIIPVERLPSGFQNNSNIQPAYIFPSPIIRDNIMGYYNGGTDVRDRSIAVTVIRGDSALVGGNVINLLSSYPGVGSDYRIREHTAKAVDIRHNTTAIGEVIPGLNTNNASASPPQLVPLPDAYNALVSDISDGVILSFL